MSVSQHFTMFNGANIPGTDIALWSNTSVESFKIGSGLEYLYRNANIGRVAAGW